MRFKDIHQSIADTLGAADDPEAAFILPYFAQQIGLLACDDMALGFYTDPALDWAILDRVLAQTAEAFSQEISMDAASRAGPLQWLRRCCGEWYQEKREGDTPSSACNGCGALTVSGTSREVFSSIVLSFLATAAGLSQ